MRHRKALALMALRLAEELLRIEREWQKERASNTAAFDAMCEVEQLADWYRKCMQAVVVE